MKAEERRQSRRSPVIGYPPREASQPRLRLVDISREGLGLETQEPYDRGSSCWLQLGERSTPVLVAGKIRWCRADRPFSGLPNDECRYRVGVQIRPGAHSILEKAILARRPFHIVQTAPRVPLF